MKKKAGTNRRAPIPFFFPINSAIGRANNKEIIFFELNKPLSGGTGGVIVSFIHIFFLQLIPNPIVHEIKL
jgi:hypothetical protein